MTAIHFQHVSKRYTLGQTHRRLTDIVAGRRARSDSSESSTLWALRDVSFQVAMGQTLGIIGSNGAGKTTTLKLMSRVTWPTLGEVSVSGRVAALIELGAGFHPELSGRENVFLNAAILGLTRAETSRVYDKIVAFAELERFMDTPVKRYSSGMFARLGFAVAAHVDPDVLLVDEVLAVGDVNFQRKCFDFIQDFVRSGRTTIFVSHNLYALEQLCDRLIWLDAGQVVAEGNAQSILLQYMDEQDRRLRAIDRPATSPSDLRIEAVSILDSAGSQRISFGPGDDITIQLDYLASSPIPSPHFAIAIWDASTRQPLIMASMLVDGQTPQLIVGQGCLQCTFREPPLMPRTYHVWGEVYGADRQTVLLHWQPLAAFSIEAQTVDGGTGALRHARSDAPVRTPYTWSTHVEPTAHRDT